MRVDQQDEERGGLILKQFSSTISGSILIPVLLAGLFSSAQFLNLEVVVQCLVVGGPSLSG